MEAKDSAASVAVLDDITASKVQTVNSTATRMVFWGGKLSMSTTAGDVNLQWAQNTSSATPTTMEAGAFLIVWEEGA